MKSVESAVFKKTWQKDGRGHYADVEVQCYIERGKPQEIRLGEWLTIECRAAALDELGLLWENWGRPGASLKAIEHSCQYCDTSEFAIRTAIREAGSQAMRRFGYCIDGGYY